MITGITKTELPGVLVIQNKVFGDPRGFFLENYREDTFNSEVRGDTKFVQDNISLSNGRNVIRGLHYQLKYPQGKLVSVLGGSILDVVVDITKDSPTYGKHVEILLEEFLGQSIFVPPGYAHGFRTLDEGRNIVCYKTTEVYHPEDAYTIQWNDKALGIDWLFAYDEIHQGSDISNIVKQSDQDKNAPCLNVIDRKYLPTLDML